MEEENKQDTSYFMDVFGRFKSHKLAMIGLIILFVEILAVVFLPIIFNLDPYTSDATEFGGRPSINYILGTDDIGRDIFARFLYGGRVSLIVGIGAASIGLVIGAPLGIIAGYYRGILEAIIMRIADIFMSFPAIMLILVIVAFTGPSIWTVTLVIGVLGWTEFARIIYGNVLSVREREYVEASRALGAKDISILLKDIIPNSMAPILITFTFFTAQAIIMESSLSFLGLGVQPPQASWGNILYDAQSITVLSSEPWRWLPPGLALIITISSINFFGDGIRDALDTKMKI